MNFDWSSLQAVRQARPSAVPEMINHALAVLADLLEEPNHACEFRLGVGPLTGEDVTVSVNALLPAFCRVKRLERVGCWRTPIGDALPGLFLPTWQPDAWVEGAPARAVAETLSVWAVVLMSRLWPDDVQCWELTVDTDDWYAGAYVDVVISHQEQVWLLHLGITD